MMPKDKTERKRRRRQEADAEAEVARYWRRPGSADRIPGHQQPVNRQAARDLKPGARRR